MAFGGPTNIPLNKSSVNGINGARPARELRMRSNNHQEKISNECNILEVLDCPSNEINVPDEVFDNEEEEACIQMYLELQKRKALENKLKSLQKKKDKMDNILKDILLQQRRYQRSNSLNCIGAASNGNNLGIHSTRYEADGSEEDEIRVRPSNGNNTNNHNNNNKTSLGNGFADVRQRNLTIATKLRELEQVELKLKQVENLMKSIQVADADDIQAVPEASSLPILPNSLVNHNLNMARASGRQSSTRKTLNDEATRNERLTLVGGNRHGTFREIQARNNALDGRRNSNKRNDNLTASRRPIEEAYRVPVYHGAENVNENCELNGSPLAEAVSPQSEESVIEMEANHQNRDSFLQSMQSNFDSLRNAVETELPWNNHNIPISNHQFFYLMLTQNYQILQQQQMLLLWLQQQSQQTQPQQQHYSNHYCRNCESVLGEENFPSPPLPSWPPSAPNSSPFAGNMGGAVGFGLGGGLSRFPPPLKIPGQLSQMVDMPDSAVNPTNNSANKGTHGIRTNNYWDNFKSSSRQNQLGSNGACSRSSLSKSNENLMMGTASVVNHQVNNGLNGFNTQTSLPKSIDIGTQESSSPAPIPATISSKSNFSAGNVKKTFSNYPPQIQQQQLPMQQPQTLQHDFGAEKIKNTPINDCSPPGIRCQPASQTDFNTLLFMLGKYMNNEGKREANSGGPGSSTIAGNGTVLTGLTQPKVKSSNITSLQSEDGAIGGDELSVSSATDKERDLMPLASSMSVNSRHHHPAPLHIPPSTGAIRKKLRNPDVIESAANKPDKAGDCLSSLSETTRPLMAAEGRSSEGRPIPNGPTSLASVKSGQPPPTMLLLRQRPPTTGATGRDDNEDNDDNSSSIDDDDELRGPEAPEIELSEAEADHSTNAVMGAMAAVSICDSTGKPEHIISSGEGEGIQLEENEEEDDEEEDNVSATGVDESRIRFSGDGEQGL